MPLLEDLLTRRKRRRKKVRLKSRYPKKIERQYQAMLRRMIKIIETRIKKELMPLLKQRSDSIEDDIQAVIDRIEQSIDAMQISPDEIAAAIEQDKIDELAKVIGVDLFAKTAGVDFSEIVKVWVAQNTRLITKMNREYIERVATAINAGFVEGLRHEEIAKEIKRAAGITWRKAALIARNEVGNLNAQITKKRNEDLGVTHYIWRTARDERVRGNPAGLYPKAKPSHWKRDGKRYGYKAGAGKKDRHPGLGIQCRCTMESIIDLDKINTI
jgi:SPP1 gp7 family putative phage head morphogenesis protein